MMRVFAVQDNKFENRMETGEKKTTISRIKCVLASDMRHIPRFMLQPYNAIVIFSSHLPRKIFYLLFVSTATHTLTDRHTAKRMNTTH